MYFCSLGWSSEKWVCFKLKLLLSSILKNEQPKSSSSTVVSGSIYTSEGGGFNANVIITTSTTNNNNTPTSLSRSLAASVNGGPAVTSTSGGGGGGSGNKNRRCPLHLLDKAKLKSINDWIPVWHSFTSEECRAKFILIETSSLLATLHSYLRKHKFCSDCKLKVLRAFSLLTGELDPSHEKGFCPAMYDGLECCAVVPCESSRGDGGSVTQCLHESRCDSSRYHLGKKHLHLRNSKEFVANLIFKAELEIHGR